MRGLFCLGIYCVPGYLTTLRYVSGYVFYEIKNVVMPQSGGHYFK